MECKEALKKEGTMAFLKVMQQSRGYEPEDQTNRILLK